MIDDNMHVMLYAKHYNTINNFKNGEIKSMHSESKTETDDRFWDYFSTQLKS